MFSKLFGLGSVVIRTLGRNRNPAGLLMKYLQFYTKAPPTTTMNGNKRVLDDVNNDDGDVSKKLRSNDDVISNNNSTYDDEVLVWSFSLSHFILEVFIEVILFIYLFLFLKVILLQHSSENVNDVDLFKLTLVCKHISQLAVLHISKFYLFKYVFLYFFYFFY